jgi:hypothetical protein
MLKKTDSWIKTKEKKILDKETSISRSYFLSGSNHVMFIVKFDKGSGIGWLNRASSLSLLMGNIQGVDPKDTHNARLCACEGQ